MSRIRSIHPDLCTDETLALASARAERTFFRLWTHLDDEGRALDNPRLLKAALYPLHDEMTAAEVDADLAELAQLGLVVRYSDGRRAYLCAKPEAWARYQSPRHPRPSKYPNPAAITADGGSGTAERAEVPEPYGGTFLGGGGGASAVTVRRIAAVPENDASSAAEKLLDHYAAEYALTHAGRPPSAAWKRQAARAVPPLLADGESPEVLAVCLAVCAKENKQPNVLTHVVSDYWREKSTA